MHLIGHLVAYYQYGNRTGPVAVGMIINYDKLDLFRPYVIEWFVSEGTKVAKYNLEDTLRWRAEYEHFREQNEIL